MKIAPRLAKISIRLNRMIGYNGDAAARWTVETTNEGSCVWDERYRLPRMSLFERLVPDPPNLSAYSAFAGGIYERRIDY